MADGGDDEIIAILRRAVAERTAAHGPAAPRSEGASVATPAPGQASAPTPAEADPAPPAPVGGDAPDRAAGPGQRANAAATADAERGEAADDRDAPLRRNAPRGESATPSGPNGLAPEGASTGATGRERRAAASAAPPGRPGRQARAPNREARQPSLFDAPGAGTAAAGRAEARPEPSRTSRQSPQPVTRPPADVPAPRQGPKPPHADGASADSPAALPLPDVGPPAGPGRRRSAQPQKPRSAAAEALEGHRSRLRARFDRGEALADYEILELLLTLSIPRRDTKPVAKALVKRFGSLAAALAAPASRLTEVDGVGERVASDFRLVRHCAERFARAELEARQTLGSTDAVVAYFRTRLRGVEREEFHVLYLDKKNGFLAAEKAQEGTVDHTPVYPREVLRRAIELGASAIVLVHNHPSGDPTPSRADVAMTKKIVEAVAPIGITVHDHLIIGGNDYVSLRGSGLM